MPSATKPLAAKLAIKPGQTVVLLNADPIVVRQIKRQAPAGVRWSTRWPPGRADLCLVWFRAKDNLPQHFKRFLRRIKPDGAVWAVVAKASVKDADSPKWETVVKAALASGVWVDNKICSVSERDYATRFVVRKEKRAAIASPK